MEVDSRVAQARNRTVAFPISEAGHLWQGVYGDGIICRLYAVFRHSIVLYSPGPKGPIHKYVTGGSVQVSSEHF